MSPTLTSSGRAIPESLKEDDHWVLWSRDEEGRKRARAPWVTGTLYPVKWGKGADERPETDWETAKRHYQHASAYPAESDWVADEVELAPMLLHEPADPPLMYIDFDDVRNPQTGEVSEEVAELVERLDAFCEISVSGTGLHLLVWARLPGGLGKFMADLENVGHIEMYDHARVYGATWKHVDGTPVTVPERQSEVTRIIKEYESPEQRRRRVGRRGTDVSVDTSPAGDYNGGDDESSVSPYFSIDIRTVADTGHFSAHRRARGDPWEGPHPEHGPIKSDPDKCTNFGVERQEDVWYCFAHDSGGRAIELAAILCPETDVSCRDVPDKSANKGWLRDRPQDLLKTCLWLREQNAVDEDARPPHAALLEVVEVADLHVRNADEGILGERNAEVAEAVYSELELADLE